MMYIFLQNKVTVCKKIAPALVSQCALPETTEIPILDVFKNTKHVYQADIWNNFMIQPRRVLNI